MSTCISRHGEYSDHEPGDWCPRCGAFNEEGIVAERDAERAHMQSLAKWASVPEDTPSVEIACEVSARIEALEAERDEAFSAGFEQIRSRAEFAEQERDAARVDVKLARKRRDRAEKAAIEAREERDAYARANEILRANLVERDHRIREEALGEIEWEYTFSEVLDDRTVAYGAPLATLAEAVEARDKARMNYPWPEEIGLGRRPKPPAWLPVVENGENK